MKRLRFGLTAAAVAAATLMLPTSSQAEEVTVESGTPGLPDLTYDNDGSTAAFGWVGAPEVGLAGSPVGKQWARVPLTIAAAHIVAWLPPPEASYDRRLDENQLYKQMSITVRSSLVSPDGSEHPYGDSALIPVKTVAFGSVPVEAILQVSLTRRADGVTDMLSFRSYLDTWYDPIIPRPRRPPFQETTYVMKPATIEGKLFVRLRSLKVDGVDAGLSDGCRTRTAAPLEASSEAWTSGDYLKEFDPAHGFMGYYGGTLNGSLDISAFVNCRTKTGDDLSPLVTSMLSGPDNPVTIQIGAPGCNRFDPETHVNLPPLPGANTPTEAKCSSVEVIPGNPRVVVVPGQLPIPDESP